MNFNAHQTPTRNDQQVKALSFFHKNGLTQVSQVYRAIINEGKYTEQQHEWARNTLMDIVFKIVKYGNPSEKQINFLKSLADKLENGEKLAADRKAQWDAERAAAQDCPVGRVTISGVIIKITEKDTQWGWTFKALVKDDRGFVVYVTAADDWEKGDRVSMTCTLTPSDNDPKFGFGKRPTNKVHTPVVRETV